MNISRTDTRSTTSTRETKPSTATASAETARADRQPRADERDGVAQAAKTRDVLASVAVDNDVGREGQQRLGRSTRPTAPALPGVPSSTSPNDETPARPKSFRTMPGGFPDPLAPAWNLVHQANAAVDNASAVVRASAPGQFAAGFGDGAASQIQGYVDAGAAVIDLATNPTAGEGLTDVMRALENEETRPAVIEAWRQTTGAELGDFLEKDEAYIGGFLTGKAATGFIAGRLAGEAAQLVAAPVVQAARDALAKLSTRMPDLPRERASIIDDVHLEKLGGAGLPPRTVETIAQDLYAELLSSPTIKDMGPAHKAADLTAQYGPGDWRKVGTSVRVLDGDVVRASPGQAAGTVFPKPSSVDDIAAGAATKYEVHAFYNATTGDIVEPKLTVMRADGTLHGPKLDDAGNVVGDITGRLIDVPLQQWAVGPLD